MSVLKNTLEPGKNVLNSYFPARTNNNEGDKAVVVRNLYRKQLNTKFIKAASKESKDKESSLIDSFRDICRRDFEDRLDEIELWNYLEEMYFQDGAIYQITPESLLFKLAPLNASSPKHRLADMFSSLMRGFYLENPTHAECNFLEQQVIDSLRSDQILTNFEGGGKTFSKGINEKAFLPDSVNNSV